jgi:hypothetical protein
MTLTITPSMPRRGGFIEISRDDEPSGNERIELLLVERLRATVIGHPVVVIGIDLPAGATTCRLPIPVDLPDDYEGRAGGWSFVVRLSRDRVGFDKVAEVPIVIDSHSPDDQHPRRFAAVSTQRRYNAKETIAPLSARSDLKSLVGIWAFGVVLSLFLLRNVGTPMIFIGPAVATAWLVAAMVTAHRQRQQRLVGLSIEASVDPVSRGQPVTIAVDNPTGRPVEVGIRAAERSKSGPRGRLVSSSIVERWADVSTRNVALATHADDPVSYAGEWISIVWEIVVRPTDLTERQRPMVEATFALVVRP